MDSTILTMLFLIGAVIYFSVIELFGWLDKRRK